ncbi:TVP38/TMEM64 family protein [Nocardia paucivorans]|uniref:TVP38/TMEM64 family protein n=1 Tax=Nocardia paucivorans TaxID=114259 RepID=UPI0002EC964B|nr:TVP38/TMEM64 family protein [Nocardia paucivorans]
MTELIRDRRIALFLLGAVVVCVAALVFPLPSPRRIQEWAQSVGPLFPLLFFLAHTLITVAPVPRTVFTVSSGILFGPALGITIAAGATTLSAILAFLLVRALDHDRVRARLNHPAVRGIDDRLARRGWLAVGSLRLIAFAPFSVVNYCCALSSVRFWPYVAATVIGIMPGTVATVVLADALTGGTHPAMVVVSIVCIAVGLLGLLVDQKWKPAEDAEPCLSVAGER